MCGRQLVGDIELSAVDCKHSLVCCRDKCNVLSEPRQARDLVAQDRDCLLVGVLHTIENCLEITVENGQWSAHLMREVSEHPCTGHLDLGEISRHRVERLRQLIKLASKPNLRDSGRMIARGYRAGRIRRCCQRVIDPPRQKQRHHD